jgi:predicted amino acid-binding ACT domain protein
VGRASEGFSATWYPHLYRIKLKKITDNQQFADILTKPTGSDADLFVGDYTAGTEYYTGQIVRYNGVLYQVLPGFDMPTGTTLAVPDNTAWAVYQGTTLETILSTRAKELEINKKEDIIVIGEEFKNIQYQMARCCSPIPGDNIFGFITINDGINIHRINCPNAENLQSKMAYRCVKARWATQGLSERIAAIRLVGIDDVGIVNKITEVISKELNVNMKSIFFEANDGLFEGKIKVLVYDTEHLDTLMRKFELVEGVKRVERWVTADE